MAHLLLIEDAPEVAQVVRILCRRAGHTLTWDEIGVSPPASPLPDLLLIDLNLPDEDGIEVYRRLQPPLRGLPAALFTQAASPARLAAALDAGIDFLVSKELLGRPDEWNARFSEVLALAAATPVVPSTPASGLRPEAIDLIARALQHPVLLRLGKEVNAALVRRALSPVLNSAVDVELSPATLPAYITQRSASDPQVIARLVHGLERQTQCLLGREASAPIRTALAAVLSFGGNHVGSGH